MIENDMMSATENVVGLLDYEEENESTAGVGNATTKTDVKGGYASVHSSSFRDFLLKPELLRAITDRGFEHPSEGKCFSE